MRRRYLSLAGLALVASFVTVAQLGAHSDATPVATEAAVSASDSPLDAIISTNESTDVEMFAGVGVRLEGVSANESKTAKVARSVALSLAEDVGVVQQQAKGIEPRIAARSYTQGFASEGDRSASALVWDVAYVGSVPDVHPPAGAGPVDLGSFGVCESHVIVDATEAKVLQIFQHCSMDGPASESVVR